MSYAECGGVQLVLKPVRVIILGSCDVVIKFSGVVCFVFCFFSIIILVPADCTQYL